jgi:hypothetical protein
MRFLTLGEMSAWMDALRREEILTQIANGQNKLQAINAQLSAIPPSMTQPFEQDQADFDAAKRIYQSNDPVVQAIQTRLMNDPGPKWRSLSQQEELALDDWTTAVDNMNSIMLSHFPTETYTDLRNFALLAIGLGAIALPLFLSEDKDIGLPFRIGPPALPPVAPSALRPAAARPGIGPTAPAVTPLRPEVIRPAVTTIPGGAAPRPFQYRTFARPAGAPPVMPAPAQVAMVPSGAAAAPPGPPHGAFAFPRFSR